MSGQWPLPGSQGHPLSAPARRSLRGQGCCARHAAGLQRRGAGPGALLGGLVLRRTQCSRALDPELWGGAAQPWRPIACAGLLVPVVASLLGDCPLSRPRGEGLAEALAPPCSPLPWGHRCSSCRLQKHRGRAGGRARWAGGVQRGSGTWYGFLPSARPGPRCKSGEASRALQAGAQRGLEPAQGGGDPLPPAGGGSRPGALEVGGRRCARALACILPLFSQLNGGESGEVRCGLSPHSQGDQALSPSFLSLDFH